MTTGMWRGGLEHFRRDRVNFPPMNNKMNNKMNNVNTVSNKGRVKAADKTNDSN